MGTNAEPYAEVARESARTWSVRIIHGLAAYGPLGGWTVWGGRERAERKARRELDRYRSNLAIRDDERFEVR